MTVPSPTIQSACWGCALVALPGGAGTAAEVALAEQYEKPVIVYAPVGTLVDGVSGSVPRATSVDRIRRFLEEHI